MVDVSLWTITTTENKANSIDKKQVGVSLRILTTPFLIHLNFKVPEIVTPV